MGPVSSLAAHRDSAERGVEATVAASSATILRMTMTVIPILLLLIGAVFFRRKYILTDEKLEQIEKELGRR